MSGSSAYLNLLALFGGFESEDELLAFCGAHHVPGQSEAEWNFDQARREALMARAWNGEAITRWQVVGHGPAECQKLHSAKQSILGFIPRVGQPLQAGELLRGAVVEKMRGRSSQDRILGPKPQAPAGATGKTPSTPTLTPPPSRSAVLPPPTRPPEPKKEPEVEVRPAWDADAPF